MEIPGTAVTWKGLKQRGNEGRCSSLRHAQTVPRDLNSNLACQRFGLGGLVWVVFPSDRGHISHSHLELIQGAEDCAVRISPQQP